MPELQGRLGRLPSPEDPRDYSIRALGAVESVLAAVTLPARYRITTVRYMGRFNQQESSCVGQSVTFAKLVQERRQRPYRQLFLNPLWLWHQSKVDDGIGQPDGDRGTYIRTALEVLRKVGHTQASNPRDRSLARPAHRIAAYYRCATVEEVKAALYARGLVVIGQAWYQSWLGPTLAGGMLPEPDVEVGGHATAAYGWDDTIPVPWDGSTGAFRVVNSWEESWGDGGDYLLPYSLVGTGKAADEAWRFEDQVDG